MINFESSNKILNCFICNESFETQKKLDIHNKKFHILLHYNCHECYDNFNEKINLYLHLLNKHKYKDCVKCEFPKINNNDTHNCKKIYFVFSCIYCKSNNKFLFIKDFLKHLNNKHRVYGFEDYKILIENNFSLNYNINNYNNEDIDQIMFDNENNQLLNIWNYMNFSNYNSLNTFNSDEKDWLKNGELLFNKDEINNTVNSLNISNSNFLDEKKLNIIDDNYIRLWKNKEDILKVSKALGIADKEGNIIDIKENINPKKNNDSNDKLELVGDEENKSFIDKLDEYLFPEDDIKLKKEKNLINKKIKKIKKSNNYIINIKNSTKSDNKFENLKKKVDILKNIHNQENYLFKKKNNKNKKIIFDCNICKCNIKGVDHYVNHMINHNNFENFICSICDANYNYKNALIEHFKTKHMIKINK